MLPDNYVDNLLKILSPSQIERLVLGNWEYDDDPSTLIDIDSINDYFDNAHVKAEGEMYMTIDVARKGKDTTVFRVWHGWKCIDRFVILKSGLDEVVRRAQRLQAKHNIPLSHIVADEDGVGGGVVDFLRCKGFINGSRPLKEMIGNEYIEPNYMNLKTQCAFRMSEMIVSKRVGEVASDTDVIGRVTQEMEQVKQKDIDKDGKISLVGKDVVKQLIGRSPDEWDSIMMRYYFELMPKVFTF